MKKEDVQKQKVNLPNEFNFDERYAFDNNSRSNYIHGIIQSRDPAGRSSKQNHVDPRQRFDDIKNQQRNEQRDYDKAIQQSLITLKDKNNNQDSKKDKSNGDIIIKLDTKTSLGYTTEYKNQYSSQTTINKQNNDTGENKSFNRIDFSKMKSIKYSDLSSDFKQYYEIRNFILMYNKTNFDSLLFYQVEQSKNTSSNLLLRNRIIDQYQ